MVLKIYIIQIGNYIKEKFINLFKIEIFPCFAFILVFFLFFSIFDIKIVQASTIQDDKLMERISNDFANKFCNSIAFGLSKESAMNFSNKENNLIFQKKKGFDSLNKELIANNIAISVSRKCGYLVNLKSEEEILEFGRDYIAMNNFIKKVN